METVSTQDSATSSQSIVKGDDGNAAQGSGRASPPPNCAICLGTCRNKSFTDSCLHQFCFKCLLTWSKVKAVCPLCKQNFRSIIHNVRSNHQYEEYMVEQRQNDEPVDRIDIDSLTSASRTFRYRTTLTMPRRDTIAIQELLLQHYPMVANMFPSPAIRRSPPSVFRRTVYRHNLWARPLPDFTGRYRDCNPEFYRYNDTQMHRLMPWLKRELLYLLNENEGHITYVMSRILELLPQHHINSLEFKEALQRYFGDRTEHFVHELYCFASTPYDMTGYDRNVQYTTDSRMASIMHEIFSNSDSDSSVDSDIVMVSSSAPADPPAGPSRVPAPVYPQNYIPDPSANNVISIETISHSDTDDDSEVMVVGYIKPPQDRTPEIVDLLGSDSDVIVQETNPEPAQSTETSENRPFNLVKLSLKWLNTETETDSDDSTYVPPSPRHRRRRRHRSGHSATATATTTTDTTTTAVTTDAHRPASTDSGLRVSSSSSDTATSSVSSSSDPASSSLSSSIATTPETSCSTLFDGAMSDSTNSSEEKRKVSKRKSKRKSGSERSKKRSKRSTSRPHHRESKATQTNSDKESNSGKRKSHSGKGVKSSKKSHDFATSSKSNTEDQQETKVEEPTASTSGTCNKKRTSDKTHKRRTSGERRRLKSVVQVIKSKKNNAVHPNGNPSRSACSVQSTNARRPEARPSTNSTDSQSSDSEDNLPLNLTIKKINQ